MFRMIGETALAWHESRLLVTLRHFGIRERQDESKGLLLRIPRKDIIVDYYETYISFRDK